MKKEDLKPGMAVKVRNGNFFTVVMGKGQLGLQLIKPYYSLDEPTFNSVDLNYDDSLNHSPKFEGKVTPDAQWDIVELYNLTEKRVDWDSVPIDAKVEVFDLTRNKWKKAHFRHYENGTVYVYAEGKTSWTWKLSEGYIESQARLSQEVEL